MGEAAVFGADFLDVALEGVVLALPGFAGGGVLDELAEVAPVVLVPGTLGHGRGALTPSLGKLRGLHNGSVEPPRDSPVESDEKRCPDAALPASPSAAAARSMHVQSWTWVGLSGRTCCFSAPERLQQLIPDRLVVHLAVPLTS